MAAPDWYLQRHRQLKVACNILEIPSRIFILWRTRHLRKMLFHFNQTRREGEPQTASIIRQGNKQNLADKISFDLEMELIRSILTKA
ncbi:hypothetical protein AAW31_02970 [Nitrosomonas communis]|uniref:Uncharacterized protein n=2 Tax=Nitrosomonas communis TaxID=44574 RepID=A0A0F7KDY7_9PROT|nr:hypothetical protein AAW31_02970 [Nitrosomonas communis]